MRKFMSQKSTKAARTAGCESDFGAAAAKVAQAFEPSEYQLRLESARIIQSTRSFDCSRSR